MEKLASTDDLPAVGVGIWPHGVGRKWLFVDDILPASGPRRVGAGLGHLERLLAPRHMVARADGGQQVDDEGQDVEGENEGNDWRPLGLPPLALGGIGKHTPLQYCRGVLRMAVMTADTKAD